MRIPIPITADRLSFAERRKKRDGRYDGDDKNKTWCGHEMIVTTVAIVTDGMDKMGCDGTEGIRTNRTDSILFFSFGARSRESIALVRVQGGNACSGFRGGKRPDRVEDRQPRPVNVLRIDTSYWVLPADTLSYFRVF